MSNLNNPLMCRAEFLNGMLGSNERESYENIYEILN